MSLFPVRWLENILGPPEKCWFVNLTSVIYRLYGDPAYPQLNITMLLHNGWRKKIKETQQRTITNWKVASYFSVWFPMVYLHWVTIKLDLYLYSRFTFFCSILLVWDYQVLPKVHFIFFQPLCSWLDLNETLQKQAPPCSWIAGINFISLDSPDFKPNSLIVSDG